MRTSVLKIVINRRNSKSYLNLLILDNKFAKLIKTFNQKLVKFKIDPFNLVFSQNIGKKFRIKLLNHREEPSFIISSINHYF